MRIKTLILPIILIIICSSICRSQTYHYSFSKNKGEFLGAFVFWSGSYALRGFTSAEIIDDQKDLDKSALWAFDRSAVNQSSQLASTWSDHTQLAAAILPIAAVVVNQNLKNDAGAIALMGLQGFFISNGLTKYTKVLAERPRPYVYRDFETYFDQPISKSATESFISGHTSSASYFSFFTAKVITDLHPDSKWKPLIWGLAAALPATTGYLRYKAGKHFPSDVIAGYAVGALTGVLIPQLYKRDNMTVALGGNGLSLSLQF